MNSGHVLELYERVIDAPEAISLLRSFIRELAVRGRLVAQDPGDEPASALLEKIAAEKARVEKQGGIQQSKLRLPIDSGTLQFSLPSTWAAARLATISLRIHYGFTASADFTLNEVRLLRITDIQDNAVNWHSVPGCIIGEDEIDRFLLRPGDILIARTGGTIGKTFLVRDVPVRAVFASYLIRVQSSDFVYTDFLKLFLESPFYWTQLQRGARGTGQPNVNAQTLGNLMILLPPFAEQRRIVAKVNELMALCDDLEQVQIKRERARDELTASTCARLNGGNGAISADARLAVHSLHALTTRPRQIKHLRQAIVNLAVRGKLVEQDTEREAVGEEFLAELKAEDLPKNWRLLNFGRHCDIEGGNQPPKSQFISEPRTGYVRLLQIRDLGSRPVPTYIPISSTSRFCKKGEILIGRYGASVGKVFWAEDGAYNVAMAKFIWPSDALVAGFAFLLLNSDYFQSALAGATRSAQAGFNKGDLAAVDFPLPPIAEQHRVVAKVNDLMDLCDRLEGRLDRCDETRQRLLDSLIAGTFSSIGESKRNEDFTTVDAGTATVLP